LIRHVGARRLSAEVVLARHPEVFVRALEPAEAQHLVKITRTARARGAAVLAELNNAAGDLP
jgi:hypothetical protein